MYKSPESEKRIEVLESELKKREKEQIKLKSRYGAARSGQLFLLILFLLSIAVGFWIWRERPSGMQASQKQIDSLQLLVVNLENKLKDYQNMDQSGQLPPWQNELHYRVQIGAYEKRDLSLFSENFAYFMQNNQQNLHKYTLGVFSSYEKAHEFRRQMISLGLRNSFVQAFYKGNPIDIEEALHIERGK